MPWYRGKTRQEKLRTYWSYVKYAYRVGKLQNPRLKVQTVRRRMRVLQNRVKMLQARYTRAQEAGLNKNQFIRRYAIPLARAKQELIDYQGRNITQKVSDEGKIVGESG
jgi:hypothetical protein